MVMIAGGARGPWNSLRICGSNRENPVVKAVMNLRLCPKCDCSFFCSDASAVPEPFPSPSGRGWLLAQRGVGWGCLSFAHPRAFPSPSGEGGSSRSEERVGFSQLRPPACFSLPVRGGWLLAERGAGGVVSASPHPARV